MSLRTVFTILIAAGTGLLALSGCGIEITAPEKGSVFQQGEVVRFKAVRRLGASAAYDIEWRSTIDGDLGTGDEIRVPDAAAGTAPLRAGDHTITAQQQGLFSWHTWRDSIGLTVAAGPVVDQSNLVPSGNLVADASQSVGQTFTVSQAGLLIGIEVAAVRCQATETDDLTLEVGQGAVSFGTASITGQGLLGPGQCGVVPAPLVLTTEGPGYFDLTPLNRTLAAGQTYFFKLTNASSRDFRIGISSDLYAAGTSLVNDAASPPHDLTFKITLQP